MKERSIGAGLLPAIAALCALALAAAAPSKADTVIGDVPPPLPPQPEAAVAETPPPLPTWFVAIAGQQVGPLTLEEVAGRIAAGEVAQGSLVWTRGMADWAPAADVGAVAALFAAPVAAAAPETVTTAEPGPDFDPEAYVAGVWTNRTPLVFDELGQTEGTLRVDYRADKRLTGGGTLYVNAPNLGRTELRIELDGTWSVRPAGPASFMLTVDMEMTLSVPVLGHSESERSSETGLIMVIDEDTIRDTDGITWVRG